MKRLRKRPKNPIALARLVVDIATGETSDEEPSQRHKSGEARAEALTPEERKAIAQKAAKARWRGDKP